MGIYRVTFTGVRWAKLTMQNVCHFEDASDVMTDQQIADELRLQWLTPWSVRQANNFGWRNISIKKIGSNLTPSTFPIVVNGTDGVDNLGGTCVTNLKIRIFTATAGKRGRGRIYLPAVRDQYIETGEYNATAVTNIAPTLAQLRARYCNVAGHGPLVIGVMSRDPAATDFHPATDIQMVTIPGIQRRRNLGVGI